MIGFGEGQRRQLLSVEIVSCVSRCRDGVRHTGSASERTSWMISHFRELFVIAALLMWGDCADLMALY